MGGLTVWVVIWLIILSIGLMAHMVKDAKEFKKIQQLQKEIEGLTQNK